MEKYYLKEDQKNNNHIETIIKKKSNSIDKINIKNRLEYSKRLQRKHFINIHKLFSKEKKYSITNGRDSLFPIFNINMSKNNSIRLKQTGNSYISTIPKEDQIEKEKIITQIFRIEDEINKKDEELNEYKDFYKQLQDNNLTFKAIIERLLNIEEGIPVNNENIKEINKKKVDDKKINRLKLQIINYDKDIEEKEKFLDKTKNKKKINNFININKLLNEKNRELENLVLGSQKLQASQ